MISIPDISQTYPKKSLTMDTQFTGPARFVSEGSAYFDGDSGKITVSAAAGINGLFATGGTFSSWVFIGSAGEGNSGRILDAWAGYRIYVANESGGSIFGHFNHSFSTTDGVWDLSSRDLNVGAWNHFAITYNGSDVANNPVMYVNGLSKSVTRNTAPVGTVDADDSDKVIGNRSADDRTFDGYICNVGMWKGTVLTAAQVKEVMMASSYGQVVNVAQPTAYYLLSANGNDSTGNFNGTLA